MQDYSSELHFGSINFNISYKIDSHPFGPQLSYFRSIKSVNNLSINTFSNFLGYISEDSMAWVVFLDSNIIGRIE